MVAGDTTTSATITPRTGALGSGRAFYIRFTLVPRDVCVALVSQVGTHFDGVRIHNTYVLTANGIDPAAVALRCISTTTPVTVTFYSG